MMDALQFWTICSANGIVLDRKQMENIERLHDELLIWNKRVNLISRQDIDNIYERHILHSLTLAKYVQFQPKARCLDIGTGGGFPGIPLKILFPELRMVLVDSIGKKIKIAGMLAQHTGLKNIEAKNIRAEALADITQYRDAFDAVTARAVAPLAQLVSWALPLLKPNGIIALLKGGSLEEEIQEAQKKFPTLRVKEYAIDIGGAPWFKKEEKKAIVCSFERSAAIVDTKAGDEALREA